MGKGKKVFEITKQILKWIWLIIPFLLLIAFIYLQAPLKILILIAIFVLESIFLPLRWRKWFWAGVGIVILVLVLWIFIPENDNGWKPFTFDAELAALEEKNKIPDEENAAVIYNQLLTDYNKSDFDPNCLDDEFTDCQTSKTFWHKKDYPQVAKWIKNHENTINELIKASEFEKCKFDLTSKSLLLDNMKMMSASRQWVQLLSRAANNDVAERRIDQGLNKYYCVLQMGKHLCQQSSLVEILVGITLKSLAIERFNNFVIAGNPDKKQLDVIEQKINEVKYDWQSDLPKVLDYEKLLFKNLFGNLYEVNAKGQFRFTRNPENLTKVLFPDSNQIPPQNYFQKKLVKAKSVLYWFFAPSTPQEFSKTTDAAYQKNYEMADPNYDWSKKPPDINFSSYVKNLSSNIKLNYKHVVNMETSITESIYYNIHDLYLRQESGKNSALLLIAIRRYKDKNGVWPENLDEIKGLTNEENFIDPVNDQFFVYKLTGDSFILYGKGKNGIDDNGERFSAYCNETNQIKNTADDIKIWPMKPCKKDLSKVKSEEPNETQSN